MFDPSQKIGWTPNPFSTVGSGQTENTQIFAYFQFDNFQKLKIDFVCPYFIGKSLSTFKIFIFGLWSFIPTP